MYEEYVTKSDTISDIAPSYKDNNPFLSIVDIAASLIVSFVVICCLQIVSNGYVISCPMENEINPMPRLVIPFDPSSYLLNILHAVFAMIVCNITLVKCIEYPVYNRGIGILKDASP